MFGMQFLSKSDDASHSSSPTTSRYVSMPVVKYVLKMDCCVYDNYHGLECPWSCVEMVQLVGLIATNCPNWAYVVFIVGARRGSVGVVGPLLCNKVI